MLLRDAMTRAPVVCFSSTMRDSQLKFFLEDDDDAATMTYSAAMSRMHAVHSSTTIATRATLARYRDLPAPSPAHSLFVAPILLNRCHEIGLARKMFDGMPERDIVTWNAMIGGYSQSGFYDECKWLYLKMLNVPGLTPNGVTVVSVMQACGESKDLVFGMEVHRFVSENGIEIDVLLCNAVIAMVMAGRRSMEEAPSET